MSARRVTAVVGALLVAVAVGWWARPTPSVRATAALAGSSAAGVGRAGSSDRSDRQPPTEEVVEEGIVEADGIAGDRAAAVAESDRRAAEARQNRERLLFDTLTRLSASADRAEAAGDLAYAEALRHRARALSQGVRMD